MPRKRIYANSTERVKAWRERQKEEQKRNKPKLPELTELEPLVDYFSRMEGLEPTESQVDILQCLGDPSIKSVAVSCGRGYSKTTLSSDAALWYADIYSRYINAPVDVLLVSSQDTIYTLLDRLMVKHPDLLSRLRNTGRSLSIPKKSLQFEDTWSQIFRVVPTSKGIRSRRCAVLIVDEAASLSDEVVNIALSCPTGNINKTILISTPHREHSIFNSIVKDKPKGWVIKQYPSTLCPWMQGTIHRLKQQMEIGKYSKEEWSVEVEGRVPETTELSFWNRKDIDKVLYRNVGLLGGIDSKVLAGIDWGYGKNNRSLTALVLVEKLRSRINVLKVSTWNYEKVTGDQAFLEIAEILNQYRPFRINADSKPSEFRGKVEEYSKNLKINYVDLSKTYIAENSEKEKESKLPFKKPQNGITYRKLALNNLNNLILTRALRVDTKESLLIEQLKNFREHMQYYDDTIQALMLAVTDFPHRSTFHGCAGWV